MGRGLCVALCDISSAFQSQYGTNCTTKRDWNLSAPVPVRLILPGCGEPSQPPGAGHTASNAGTSICPGAGLLHASAAMPCSRGSRGLRYIADRSDFSWSPPKNKRATPDAMHSHQVWLTGSVSNIMKFLFLFSIIADESSDVNRLLEASYSVTIQYTWFQVRKKKRYSLFFLLGLHFLGLYSGTKYLMYA